MARSSLPLSSSALRRSKCDCRFSQNCAEVPLKNRSNLSAVSGVKTRVPLRMPLTRFAGFSRRSCSEARASWAFSSSRPNHLILSRHGDYEAIPACAPIWASTHRNAVVGEQTPSSSSRMSVALREAILILFAQQDGLWAMVASVAGETSARRR
jgi:hypothetical protein